MKKKHFYSHLIEIDSLIVELKQMDMAEDEKIHLITLVESNIHHVIFDAILSELSEADKILFLENVSSDNHQKIWEHLNSKVNFIEEKIQKAAEDLKKEIRKDIIEAKK